MGILINVANISGPTNIKSPCNYTVMQAINRPRYEHIKCKVEKSSNESSLRRHIAIIQFTYNSHMYSLGKSSSSPNIIFTTLMFTSTTN